MKASLLGISFMALIGLDAAAMEIRNEQRLPSLSAEDQAATTGQSMHHSQWAKDHFGEMHKTGDTWPEDKLARIFGEGLFQHYTHQLGGFDYVTNFVQYQTMDKTWLRQYDFNAMKKLWEGVLSPEQLSQIAFNTTGITTETIDNSVALAEWLRAVGNALKNNRVFFNLGADFQRKKIILEKAERALSSTPELEKAAAGKRLYALDREHTDMQIVIFHWMQQTYAQARAYLKDYLSSHEGKLPPLTDPYFAKITTTYPEFAYWPVYAGLLRELPPLPVKARSIDELTQDMIALAEDFEIIGKLHEAANKAFKDEASDEDFSAYAALFQQAKEALRSVFEIKQEEEVNFEQALERVAVG